ncbi:MAG: hypothetical protein JOZ36_13155 [Acidobacteria bacterium]|nr:hypothetical protein [Acidobacteriota bacterium]
MYSSYRARWFLAGVVAIGWVAAAAAQQSLPEAPQPQTPATTASPSPAVQSTPSTKGNEEETTNRSGKRDFGKTHIFWIIPNYRADEGDLEVKPLTPRQKFKVALDDSFDPSAFLVAGVFAGISMAQRQYAHFGQGAVGFGKYYGGAFADQAVGNFMTEALFPIALHQDPRYFTKGKGGFWRRTGYAISREVITLGDDGRQHFNTSELAGNFVAAGISNVYYPAADRSFSNTVNKWSQQIALDTFFNIMKEFWPDMRRKIFHAGS